MNLNVNIASLLKKVNFRDKKVQAGAMIVLLGLGGAFFWYSKIYTPAQTDFLRLEQERKDKEDKLNSILAIKPQLERIRAEIEAKGQLLDSLKSIFPDQKEVPKLLNDITRLSQASDIFTIKFNPMQDQQQEYYVENRYALTMWGRYDDFASFLSRLANLKLIINLSDVKLNVHPRLEAALAVQSSQGAQVGQQPAAPEYTIEAGFTLTTFSSKK
jgi:type IV pilus assembly protein PilO